MIVIAQWYICSITFFFLRMRLEIMKKLLEPNSNLIIFKKGLHFREQFYSLSEHVSTSSKLQSYKVLDQKILEQRLLPKLTFAGSDLSNNHS